MSQVSGSQIVSSSNVLSSGIASADHLTTDGMLIYLQTRLTGIDDQINAAFEKQQKIEQIRKIIAKLQNAVSSLSSDDGGKLTDAQRNQFNAALAELELVDPFMAKSIVADLKRSEVFEKLTMSENELRNAKRIEVLDDLAAENPSGNFTRGGAAGGRGQVQNPSSETQVDPSNNPGNFTRGGAAGGPGQVQNPSSEAQVDPSNDPGNFTRGGAAGGRGQVQSPTPVVALPSTEMTGSEVASVNQILSSRTKQLESSAQLEMIQLQSLMSARQTAIQLATNLIAALGKSSETVASNARV